MLNWLGLRNDRYALNAKVKPLIQHEIAHLTNNHVNKDYIALLLAPFFTHWSIKGARTAYKFIKPTIIVKAQPGIWHDVAKFPTGLIKGLVTGVGIKLYSKHQEQQADNQVESTIENLEHFKKLFEQAQKNREMELTENNRKKTFSRGLYDTVCDLHPTIAKALLTQKDNLVTALDRLYQLSPGLIEKAFLDPDHPSVARRIKKLDKRIEQLKREQEKNK